MTIVEINAGTQVTEKAIKVVKDIILKLNGETEVAVAFDAYIEGGYKYIDLLLYNNSANMEYNVSVLGEDGNKLCNDMFLPSKYMIKQTIFKQIKLVHKITTINSLNDKSNYPIKTFISLVLGDKKYDIDVDAEEILSFIR